MDPWQQYLAEIRGVPLLTAEEERTLALRVAAGDGAARDALVRANLRLVTANVGRYRGLGLDPMDLAGEGNLGLIRAAETFRAAYGTRFSTHAVRLIRQAIRRAVQTRGTLVRVPTNLRTPLRWRREREAALTQELGREPGPAELARALAISRGLARREEAALAASAVITQDVGDVDEARVRPSSIAEAEAREETARLAGRLAGLLRAIPAREREVVALRFGLGGAEHPLTLEAAGRELGVTRERVRQIEARALDRLRVAARGLGA